MISRNTLLALLVPGLLLAAPVAADDDATVTVIHGIPGKDLGLDPELPVDVFISGLGCALPDFRYGDQSPRVSVAPDSYDVTISLADAETPCGGAVVIEAPGVPFAAGESATVIAHLTESGGITATKYTNDLAPGRADEGKLALHHVAGVGPVDIALFKLFDYGSNPIELDGVSNPQSATLDLDHGYYIVTVAPAGGRIVDVELVYVESGESQLVYATGSLENRTFAFLADEQELAAPAVDGAIVTVIHGIPGLDVSPEIDPSLPVDVWISGLGCALPDFRFGEITDRIPVPAATYDIQITLATETSEPCEGPLAVDAPGVSFEPGENATVIAHLAADGTPTATKFTNDLSDDGPDGRLAVHHTAAVGAVDVDIFRRFFFFQFPVAGLDGVVNGDAASVPVWPGRYRVALSPAGGSPVFVAKTRVRRGRANFAYAVGSLTNGTFTVLVDSQPLD